MNLSRLAADAAARGTPVRAGLIGAGKFGSMFLSQVPTIGGLEVAAIADLNPDRARAACRGVGWDDDRLAATAFLDDGASLAARDDVDVVIEATGNPRAGIAHARAAIAAGKHVVMVNVEADVLAGVVLAREAEAAGVVYSMAYGDQPALVSEMVDWARAAGFHVTAAGKGTKYLPAFHAVTPDDVWQHYGLTPDAAKAAGMNPQMFNSFLDGTKSAIEMVAIANACGLTVPSQGLTFPPCGVDDLAHVMRPRAVGGQLDGSGMVETVSSLERDGRPVFRDLRWGVYVVFEAPNDYAAACFAQYGLPTDSTGRYAAMYKPFHLIGLELSVSVLSAALRNEPTGCTRAMCGTVASVAKRDLKAGEVLDGEGGYTVWGKALPITAAGRALPIGLAHNVTLTRDVAQGQVVMMDGVDMRNDPIADLYIQALAGTTG
ncbi:NAD(P)H-dependent oxidoreductase [Thalassobacter stenotrophicus]|uniref:Predicted homoserine dehydrogenase, contains C-terminal SAF domain n=2 Tax=Thalassobacter stenotrophicus TaxID=266809 RepID=A0ABY1IL46_9RHOB|nr:Gfo/Idh/MocA family oxidoreductase [Thalassobacter stenotrophicus]CUH61584.1 putative homoserine dehydrogenase [Thalassobacter stenotrophicus]SHJ35150.1 Predicted homoserine dehydrogenase, contains C-terminal SAF domain [Thalassobacter stenotrophicus DSM 16310]